MNWGEIIERLGGESGDLEDKLLSLSPPPPPLPLDRTLLEDHTATLSMQPYEEK